MRRPTKREVYEAAMWGHADARDVIIVSRDRRSVRYRHAWPEDVDERVWYTIFYVVMAAVRDLARETGECVEVYCSRGCLLVQCYPDE